VARQPQLCRALGTHAWTIVGPIVVLKADDRRITLHCDRCGTWRSDVWSRRNGAILTRYYKHDPAYKSFIHEHNHAEARGALLGALKEIPSETNNSGLRLLQGSGKKTRRRNPKSAGRKRDKKRAVRSVP
jgi:hypothetical protein